MARRRNGCEAYVENWCLEHECFPDDLDVEVVEAMTFTTRLARQYRPQYTARFTEKYHKWYWRKIVTLIKDSHADPERYIWSQIKRNKSRFNPSNLLQKVAQTDYADFLKESLEEETETIIQTLEYILTTTQQIPADKLFGSSMNSYSEIMMYTTYVLIYSATDDFDNIIKYTNLAEELKETAKKQFNNNETKEAFCRALRRFDGIGLRVKEILINTLS